MLAEKLNRYAELKDMSDTIKKELSELRNEITLLIDAKPGTQDIDGYKVQFNLRGKTEFDKKGLERDYPEIYEKYTYKTENFYFSVKRGK